METGSFRADSSKLVKYKRAIERKYELERESRGGCKLEQYDTFDWRLYEKGLFAYSNSGSFTIGESLAGPPSLACSVGAAVPRFWWEFEDPEARVFLQDITGVRALLPLAETLIDQESYSVRNRDGKIVCRLSFLTSNPVDGSRRSYLLVKPLRGYPVERNRISSLAVKSGMDRVPVPILEDLLLSSGRQPGGYSSKLDLLLGRKMTISEAVVLINRQLLSTITSNIQGVVEDYDTEFLHDLRVATRRTRACLTQLREALPTDEARRYGADFKSVAQRCNALRDLDVYLLEREHYYDVLPVHLHKGLDQYFKYVTRKRTRRQREFSAYLETNAFTSLLRDWEGFLQDPAALVNDSPAIEVAGAKIQERFQRIIKRGRKIDDISPNARLHELRIECKKLRYLLEFFNSYYPQKKMNALVLHLKEFQDNLGEFNDLTVQQEDLGAYLRSSKSDVNSRLRDAAIGGLLTVLNSSQVAARKEFYRRFAAFDSRENRALYGELFQQRKA